VAFSPDGKILATGGGKGDVRFWEATTGTELGRRVNAWAGFVLDLSWSPSGETLVSTGTDGTVRLIDVNARAIAGTLPGLDNTWVAATRAPGGQRVFAVYATGQGSDWSINPDDWASQACTVAGRTLTQSEWDQYLPNRPYSPACALIAIHDLRAWLLKSSLEGLLHHTRILRDGRR
jgi:WD40 repeat protein